MPFYRQPPDGPPIDRHAPNSKLGVVLPKFVVATLIGLPLWLCILLPFALVYKILTLPFKLCASKPKPANIQLFTAVLLACPLPFLDLSTAFRRQPTQTQKLRPSPSPQSSPSPWPPRRTRGRTTSSSSGRRYRSSSVLTAAFPGPPFPDLQRPVGPACPQGFTGQLAAAYLAANYSGNAKPAVRWAHSTSPLLGLFTAVP